MKVGSALKAVAKHPSLLLHSSKGTAELNRIYWRMEFERNMALSKGFFESNPEGLVSIEGVKIYLRPADLEYFYPLTQGRPYEPKTTAVFQSLIDSESVVVDAGANIGWYTLLAAKKAKMVHSFEPEPENFKILQKSIQKNDGKNVEAHNICLADHDGTVELSVFDTPGGHSIVKKEGVKTISVECKTLDSLFPTETIDLLKLDVEGAEFEVLNGAQKLIQSGRIKRIIMEHNFPFSNSISKLIEDYSFVKIDESRVVNVLLSLQKMKPSTPAAMS